MPDMSQISMRLWQLGNTWIVKSIAWGGVTQINGIARIPVGGVTEWRIDDQLFELWPNDPSSRYGMAVVLRYVSTGCSRSFNAIISMHHKVIYLLLFTFRHVSSLSNMMHNSNWLHLAPSTRAHRSFCSWIITHQASSILGALRPLIP